MHELKGMQRKGYRPGEKAKLATDRPAKANAFVHSLVIIRPD